MHQKAPFGGGGVCGRGLTRGKPLLAERQPVAGAPQLHVRARQRAALAHELHRQRGRLGRAVRHFKLGPQGAGACSKATQSIHPSRSRLGEDFARQAIAPFFF